MEEIRRFVGSKIKEYRKAKRLTQKELGDKLGVRDNTISSYESGTNEVNLETLYKLAAILDKSIDDFFPETNDGGNEIHRIIKDGNLNKDDLDLIENITKKALELEPEDRKKLMSNIKLAVNFFENSPD